MTTPITKWPALVSALVSLWQAHAGPDDGVYDGPPVTVDIPLRWVTVGWAEDDQGVASGSPRRMPMYDGSIWGESGNVLCEIVAQTTSGDLSVARASAWEFFDVLAAAVRSDRTFGGVLSPEATVEIQGDGFPEADAGAAIFHIRVEVTYTTT
jgi:hypothetical protein